MPKVSAPHTAFGPFQRNSKGITAIIIRIIHHSDMLITLPPNIFYWSYYMSNIEYYKQAVRFKYLAIPYDVYKTWVTKFISSLSDREVQRLTLSKPALIPIELVSSSSVPQ